VDALDAIASGDWVRVNPAARKIERCGGGAATRRHRDIQISSGLFAIRSA
jgi:hypothetical protein